MKLNLTSELVTVGPLGNSDQIVTINKEGIAHLKMIK